MNNIDRRTLEAILRQDFGCFIQKTFGHLHPGQGYLSNWHLEAIAWRLELVRQGKIKRLIINMPPRSLKSIVASVAFPAFILGHDPRKKVISVSYGDELTVKNANDFRAVVASEWYQKLFPAMRPSRTKNTEAEFTTNAGGFRLATSVGGVLTGRGGNIIIIDDPLKPADALSDPKREAVNRFYSHTLISRLDNKNDGAIVIVMQRLHMDDLVGRLLHENQEEWTVLTLPAIASARESTEIAPGVFYDRAPNEPLHPQRESIETLQRLRVQTGSDTFEAQYQQAPVPPGGAMIKRKWVQRYNTPPARSSEWRVVMSWDTASKDGAANDWSVCTTWLKGVRRECYYLIDVFRERVDYPTLKEKMLALTRKHSPNEVLIEDAGAGTALIQELRRMGKSAIAVKPDKDKITRMSIESTKFESGSVYFPEHASWLAEVEAELFSFPNGRHDDIVDSISQALKKRSTYDLMNAI